MAWAAEAQMAIYGGGGVGKSQIFWGMWEGGSIKGVRMSEECPFFLWCLVFGAICCLVCFY